jgi:hypothetical protein
MNIMAAIAGMNSTARCTVIVEYLAYDPIAMEAVSLADRIGQVYGYKNLTS